MLSVRLPIRSRLLIGKFGGNQKLQLDFLLGGGRASLTHPPNLPPSKSAVHYLKHHSDYLSSFDDLSFSRPLQFHLSPFMTMKILRVEELDKMSLMPGFADF